MSDQDDVPLDVFTIDLNPGGVEQALRDKSYYDDDNIDEYSQTDDPDENPEVVNESVELVDDIDDETIMKVCDHWY